MHFSVAVAPIDKNLITGTIHHDCNVVPFRNGCPGSLFVFVCHGNSLQKQKEQSTGGGFWGALDTEEWNQDKTV